MTMHRTVALVAALAASPALAWQEPARGSDLRADLMDAIRPIAEWYLNPPVEFVVHEARVQGDRAYVAVHAQRPGGGVIDPATAPGVLRGEIDGFAGDPTTMQALLQRSGRMWVAVHYGVAATDVWFSDPLFCPGWGGVLPEFCNTTVKN